MNKQLKLLQRSKVLKTLEVKKVKHDLSKIKNSTIVMVAYDDATDKFLIGDNSGDLYVATSEYLKSLDIKNSSIDSIISGLNKSSIAQYFNKISLQEAKEMFGNKYCYYWSANNRIYGVKRGLIERLDNGPDNTNVVKLWDRTENVLSNDRGVTGLKEVKFYFGLRPAFLTFDKEAIPTYERDQNLIVRDPVKIADIMNKDINNTIPDYISDYIPKDDKYGYDMKDSNAVMKAYLNTDDLVVLSNIDKREIIDINPPNTDPDNPNIVYKNNTPFNHNYNMVWSTIRSARLFEEFNDEANDSHPEFVNMTRHEQNELTEFTGNEHIVASGLYANIPNLSNAYSTYIKGKNFGDKQIYSSGEIGVAFMNDFRWSLDKIDGKKCTITKRVYYSNSEIINLKRTYDGIVEYEFLNIEGNGTKYKKTFRIPSLNNIICDINKFEYKLDAVGNAISLPIPEEYEYVPLQQTLTVANHANDYNFHTVAKDFDGNIVLETDTMNITERLGNVTLQQAASMLLNNTDNAKNKVYIGDYFELGGYTWQNNSGTTFTAGTAKYTLVERTVDGNLIFMSSERHKLTSESGNALTWTQLITENKLETILLPQLESILGITPVSYTRKSDIPHLTNKRVFLPTEYEIFGTYKYQKEDERYEGERQWEIFNFKKESNRKIFRRDVITGNINNYAPSNNNNGYGYWLATNSSHSGSASYVSYPDNSDFGFASYDGVSHGDRSVRPCFML